MRSVQSMQVSPTWSDGEELPCHMFRHVCHFIIIFEIGMIDNDISHFVLLSKRSLLRYRSFLPILTLSRSQLEFTFKQSV